MINKDKGESTYPDHLIDPLQKGRDWCLAYAKAAWKDYNQHGEHSFHNNRGGYVKVKDYAQGNQSINSQERRSHTFHQHGTRKRTGGRAGSCIMHMRRYLF